MTGPRGFTLVEILLASAIALAVIGAALAFAIDAQGSWHTESARLDLQQRARVAADIMTRALREAGLGAAGAAGPLVRSTAPILPRRVGARGAESPSVVRRDLLTIVRGLGEADHAALLIDLPAGSGTFELAPSSACAQPSCGLSAGMHVLVTDGRGNHDVFTVLTVFGATITTRHHGTGAVTAYPAGSLIVPVHASTFFLDSRTRVLREYNGDASDLPLVDDVVGMEVEYFGEPRPPVLPKPAPGHANCLYAADGSYNTALMPVLSAPAGFAVLSPSLLGNGPWCGGGARQFDADLLRVRRVRVSMRLQATDPAVRGKDPVRFQYPGSAQRSGAMVPDAHVIVDVTPPNLVPGAWP